MYIFTCTCICAYIYPHTHVAAYTAKTPDAVGPARVYIFYIFYFFYFFLYTAKTPDAVGPARVARDPGASFECAGQPFQSLYQYEVLN